MEFRSAHDEILDSRAGYLVHFLRLPDQSEVQFELLRHSSPIV